MDKQLLTLRSSAGRSMTLLSLYCDIVCHLHFGLWAWRPKVRKKSRKGFPGGAQKVRKQSKINSFSSFFQVFNPVFDFFLTFSAPRSQEAREPFSRLFSDFGPKGPNDPCKWSPISQSLYVFFLFPFICVLMLAIKAQQGCW